MDNNNCENNESKCCTMKLCCKAMVVIGFVAALGLIGLLYVEARNVRVELKELNTSLDFAAQYLDNIRADISHMNENIGSVKDDVAEMKNAPEQTQ